jgi:hypothetical protein
VSEGTHENKGSIHVEKLSNKKNFPGGFNSNSEVNYGWFTKGMNLPKVGLRKFDGTYFFNSVNQVKEYFELHNIMDDKKMIHIVTLNFEIKPYQWVVEKKPHSYHYTWGLFTRELEAQYGKVLVIDKISTIEW